MTIKEAIQLLENRGLYVKVVGDGIAVGTQIYREIGKPDLIGEDNLMIHIYDIQKGTWIAHSSSLNAIIAESYDLGEVVEAALQFYSK